MIDFYSWIKTFSYDARLNLIITSRGRGKTYGLRKQFVKDWIAGKWRFVEIVRYNNQVADVCDGYFDKLVVNNEFPDYVFRTEGGKMYIAHAPADDEKPTWELIGYCVSLNDQQNKKKKTFAHVKRVLFDEFILEKRSFPGYLAGEYDKFLKLLDSIAREVPGEPSAVRVYLCANACDLVNPYFSEFRIYDEPKPGYTWLDKGFVLLHYEINEVYSAAKRDTLVGRLARGHIEDMITNRFDNANNDFIERKSKDAKFLFGFVFQSRKYGVWLSDVKGYYYVTGKIPANAQEIYSLTRDDMSPNLIMARKAEYKLKVLIEMLYLNCVRYDTAATREGFLRMSSLFGVR